MNVFPDSYSFFQFVLLSSSRTLSCFLVHQLKGLASLSEGLRKSQNVQTRKTPDRICDFGQDG